MKETVATTLADLQARIARLDPTGIWIFRGQKDAAWPLVPSLYRGLEQMAPPYRQADAPWVSGMERDVYRKFAQLVRRYCTPASPWEEICLAQHYQVPTRLLDWTRHAMAAAYFALDKNSNAPAAVWCFDIARYPFPAFLGRITRDVGHRLDVLSALSLIRPPSFFQQVTQPSVVPKVSPVGPADADTLGERELGLFVVLDPPHFDARIAAQQGLFTMYYSLDDSDLVWDHGQHMEDVAGQTGMELVQKIVIPNDAKDEIRISLERMIGVNWHELFPDLPGVGMYLSELREDILNASRREREKTRKG